MRNPAKVIIRTLAAGFLLLFAMHVSGHSFPAFDADRPALEAKPAQKTTFGEDQGNHIGWSNLAIVGDQLPTTVYVDASFTEATPGWGDDHFNTIRDAIARVEAGGTVMVAPGTYAESVTINKSLTLQGADRETTIIRAQDNENTINVSAADVVIKGFTLQDGQGGTWGGGIVNDWRGLRIRVEDCIIENNNNAFYVWGNDHVIKNNIIRNNHRGVWITNGDSVTIAGNLIEGNNYQGIDCRVRNSMVRNNHLRDNLFGISLSGGNAGNVITENEIEENRDSGIRIFNASSNGHIIHSNRIKNNVRNGIIIHLESRGHTIYNNYFSDNDVNASDDTDGNTWNIAVTPGENIIGGPYLAGNYWSDYEGDDNTGNGIGDTELPYNASGRIQQGGDDFPIVKSDKRAVVLFVLPEGIESDADLQGTGLHEEGSSVTISANEVMNYLFVGWTGTEEDMNLLADASALQTSFIMPARTVVLTAHYEWDAEDGYMVSLNVLPEALAAEANPQGAGLYMKDDIVNIAVSEPDRYLFTEWTGLAEDVALLEDASAMTTSFAMPERNVSFTANFEEKTYSLSLGVIPSEITGSANRQGAGDYTEDTEVNISVNAVGGYDFIAWEGSAEDVALLADASALSTSLIMPARDVLLNAHYDYIGLSTVTYVDVSFDEETPGWGRDHFNSINEAIAWVETGGTVMVAAGVYAQSVSTNKSVTLQGANRETTIIRAQDNANAVYIATRDVTIKGFTIQDGNGGTWGGGIVNDWTGHNIRVEDCIIENNHNAFYIIGNGHVIKNNIIRNNHRGVWVSGGESVTISGNLIEGNSTQGVDGRGKNVLIKDNHIRDNSIGIAMAGGSVDNTVIDNVIEDSRGVGISIFNATSTGHVIHSNTIVNNKDNGIEIRLDSRGHTIYNNYFSNNVNASDNTDGNTWNIEVTPGENILGGSYLAGNYWSDYQGVDNTGDGIGDTELPYNASGQIQQGGDHFPLVYSQERGVELLVAPEAIFGDANPQGAGLYAAGVQVTISVEEVENHLFTGWAGHAEDVALLGDASARETSFTMPARNVVFTATFSSTIGVAEKDEPFIRVYPVPASDVLRVEATEAIMQLRLIDMAGRVLSEAALPGHHATVEVTHLLPGSYFLQVITISQSMVLPVQVAR